MRERLLALAAEHKEKEEQGLINDKEGQLDEEEIFGSGLMNLLLTLCWPPPRALHRCSWDIQRPFVALV